MTRLWDLWEAYCDRIPFPPSNRRFAAKIGMSPTAFGNWQHAIKGMPKAHNLAQFAREISMPYERVLDAALHDAGYLPEPTDHGSLSPDPPGEDPYWIDYDETRKPVSSREGTGDADPTEDG